MPKGVAAAGNVERRRRQRLRRSLRRSVLNMKEAGASLLAVTHTVTECSENAERLSNGTIYI